MDYTTRRLLDDFLADLRLSGRVSGDRYRWEVERSGLTWDATPQQVRAWLASLPSPASAHASMRHLKPFWSWLVREATRDQSPFAGVRITAKPEPQRTLTDDEVERAIRTARNQRDRTVLALLAATGARRGEIGSLTVEDATCALGSGMVRITRSKSRARYVPLDARAESLLRKWLRNRDQSRPAANLWGVRDGSQVVTRACRRAGVTAHSFRRWFATRWLLDGGSSASLMRIAGWESPAMVLTYTRATADDVALAEYRRLRG